MSLEKPVSDLEKPASGLEKPASGLEKPVSGLEKSVSDLEKQLSGSENARRLTVKMEKKIGINSTFGDSNSIAKKSPFKLLKECINPCNIAFV
ncbi:MAG: hypothetical protein LBU34_08575 [Planctomycetaceae bacterium]|nr:hypothetical protein [Planctomycetaceae bacterium]